MDKVVLKKGDRFGSWIVLSKDEQRSKEKQYSCYFCKCNCGKIESVRAYRLTNGYTTNCRKCGFEKRSITRRYNNKYDLSNDSYIVGWSSNTNKEFYVDKDKYELIKDYTWYESSSTGYLYTTVKGKNIMLHRLVTNAKKNETVDHIHGVESKMDNRSSNLRIVTKGQNNINVGLRKNNKSGVTGVWWSNKLNKWVSKIGYNNKSICLGHFDNFEEAVKARKEAENKYYGEYSYDNSQKN